MKHAIDRLTADPEVKENLTEMAEQLAAAALEISTPERMHRAQHRLAAAAHEAGHAVIYTCEGVAIRSIRIWKVEGAWVGETREATDWHLTPDMGAAAYLCRARAQLAGLCGELICGCDVLGSSPDEIAVSLAMTQSAAALLGVDPLHLWLTQVLGQNKDLLHRHGKAHRRLTGALLRQRRISGPRLDALLRGVDRA